MKDKWKEFLHFNQRERSGLFFLLFLCLLLLLLPVFQNYFYTQETTDFSLFQKEVNSFLEENEQVEKTKVQKIKVAAVLFSFNPNTLPEEDFIRLGLPQKIVSRLINYRNKGGRFFKKEDLQKIYGLSSEDFQRLLPYIDIPQKNDFQKNKKQQVKNNFPKQPPTPIHLRPFDPNTVSKEELISLGISPKAANILINFRKKGGTFRKKEDFKKIFGISAEDYQRLEPFLEIAGQKYPQKPSPKKLKEKNILIDINNSTAEDWQQLKGIGPVFSKRIIAWREKLGGFNQLSQIADTYGLPDSVFQKIAPHLQVSPVQKTLLINQADSEDLRKHPYLNYRQANAIVNYRDKHGPFSDLEALKKMVALPEEVVMKIEPYVLFE